MVALPEITRMPGFSPSNFVFFFYFSSISSFVFPSVLYPTPKSVQKNSFLLELAKMNSVACNQRTLTQDYVIYPLTLSSQNPMSSAYSFK